MGRKPKSIIVHLRTFTNLLEGYLQYEPTIKEPEALITKSTIHYEPYQTDDHKDDVMSLKQEDNIGNNIQLLFENGRDALHECNNENHNTNVYPRKSEKCCWWDGYPFHNKPCFLPKGPIPTKFGSKHTEKDDERDFVNGYEIYGNFCSPECALAYLDNQGYLDPEIRWERAMVLHEMVNRAYNNDIDRIKPALPRWVLNDYGGSLTIEQYRELHTMPNIQCEVIYPPIAAEIPMLRLQTKDVIIKRPTKVIIEEERFEKAEENIRKIQQRDNKVPKKEVPMGNLTNFMNIRYVDNDSP